MGQADIALRHVTRQHPEDLARGLLPPGLAFEVVGWLDTQLTSLERRLDKALDLRVAGERRLLHIEIELDIDRADARRIHEYGGLLGTAIDTAPSEGVEVAARMAPAWRAQVPIHSVVIVLRGRKASWPSEAEYGTGWPELPWSGTRFHVEAVYQRTVAALRARGSALWLVFTPLAPDATAGAMAEVLAEIRQRMTVAEERADLFAALLMMAEIDPWGHNLREEIKTMMRADYSEILSLSPTLRNAFEEGMESGELRVLGAAFAEQVGHAASAEEQQALARRAKEVGAEQAIRAVLRLHGDALAAWLLGGD